MGRGNMPQCHNPRLTGMNSLFLFPNARRHDTEVRAWFMHDDLLRGVVEPLFERLKACGPEVRELIHDGRPTACANEAAFAYVDAYGRHANIGFFFGAFLDDPAGLLEGSGKRMRHVKLRPDRMPDQTALGNLVCAAYRDIHARLAYDQR